MKTPYAGAEGMLLLIKGKETMWNEKSSCLFGQYFSFTVDLKVKVKI